MQPAEETNPRLDPDDTAPVPVIDAPPLRRLEPGRAFNVDRAARELARLCAGWAHRGRSLEDLVGLAHGCACRPKVMPRVELPSRLAPGPMLDALRASRTVPGRLAVVETTASYAPGEERREFHEHHIHVPQVDSPDTRDRLEPLSAERGALLARRLEEFRPRLARVSAKELFDNHTLDALYLEADLLERGGCFQVRRRRDASPEGKQRLDAADYEVRPGMLLCIVRPDWVWQHDAVAWIELEQLGLCLEGDSCREHLRLYEVFMAPQGADPVGQQDTT